MNPFLDQKTQSYCPECLRTIGEFHADGCENNPFENPAATQKLLASRPTEEDLERAEAIRAIGEIVSHLSYKEKSKAQSLHCLPIL